MSSSPAPLFLAGPTAAGKSAVALHLADRIGGEIISVDSMQVYRGMDIGTGKPSLAERAQVPHHLIDIVDLSAGFDAATFVEQAKAAVEQIQGRHRVPIFCGGTGLYFQAYLQGLGEAPPADPALRDELEQRPLPDLLQELARLDPACFAEIDRANPRRVIRALEVTRLTGRPFSGQRAKWESQPPLGQAFFGLERAPAGLQRRIDTRVDRMFADGLVSEVKLLLTKGLAENQTALQALGYRQVAAHLQGGPSLQETIAMIKQKTRQYAKRQRTWFRRQTTVDWIAVSDSEPPETVAKSIAARYRSLTAE